MEVRSRDNSRMFALRRKRNGSITHVNRTVLVFLNIGDVSHVREKLLMSQREGEMTGVMTLIRPKGTESSTQVEWSFNGITQFLHSNKREGRIFGYRYK